MADFNGSKPVQTVRDDEFKIKIVDSASGDTATKVLNVVVEGDTFVATTNDAGIPCIAKNASGDAVILPVPLPITDNGGSLTVDGSVSITGDVNVTATDLDIRNLAFATDTVDVSGSDVSITGDVNVTATDLDIRNLAFATDTVDVSGSAVSITGDVNVTATDLDIRNLTHASDSVKIGDGTDFLAVNTDGSINVNVVPGGTKILDYQTSATVSVNNEVLHFYVVTDTLTFEGLKVLVGARGAVKVRVGLSSNGTSITAVKFVYFQDPKENIDHDISNLVLLGDGTAAIAIGITNLDGQTSDVYSTLQGIES
jgi:adhesin HecA-like repeat protein